MAKGLIRHIANKLKSYPSKVLLVENNDRFLYRQDVVNAFKALGFEIRSGSSLDMRISFELRELDGLLILLTQDNTDFLEDIKKNASSIEFNLANYLQGYHIPSVINLDLPLLDKLFNCEQLITLNRNETLLFIDNLESDRVESPEPDFNLQEFIFELNALLQDETINWAVVSRLIAHGLLESIGKPQFETLYMHINKANEVFQKTLRDNFHQTKNSSAVKKPRIVSKILDYLNFNYREDKIALIVVDGMAFWQYVLLSNSLPTIKNEEVIYSWLPSITQLSRQAIFRGDTPKIDYRQRPLNEKKLWKDFWLGKGCHDFEIGYQHETTELPNLDSVNKLALVFKDLDDKMHNSTDYNDLFVLTKNWIERSNITQIVDELLQNGFTIFMTTDHGNVQAKGWRGLQGREKLGTNKSGSRSERHIEYTEQWLLDELLENNPELKKIIVMDEKSILLKSDLSFSNKDSLVSHGGAHMLEVLIPFIEIKNEA